MKSNFQFALLNLVFFAGLSITSCQNNTNQTQQAQADAKGGKLDISSFEKKLNDTKDGQILDVRTAEEYSGGHLKNAKNIDWNGDHFEADAQKLDKTKPVFVYCLAGGRSASAAGKMKELGFKEIYEMQGGMREWNKAGKPVVTEKNAAPTKGMTIDEFTKQINSDKFVLVNFNAPWCGPCKKMAPFLKEMEVEQKGKFTILKINSDDNVELTSAQKVDALPTLFFYKSGKEVWKHIGLIEKKELLDALQAQMN